jgi:ATP synthase protein I
MVPALLPVRGAKRAPILQLQPQEMTEEGGKPRPLEDLEARLGAARAGRPRERVEPVPRGVGAGLGARVGVELVAGIAVGSGLGYGLDAWLGTRPWLMVLFFFLGAAASVVNIYRAAHGLDDSVGLAQAQRRKEDGHTE